MEYSLQKAMKKEDSLRVVLLLMIELDTISHLFHSKIKEELLDEQRISYRLHKRMLELC
jgi:hypothetical protein